jgi:hypothetical protein
MRGGAPVPQDTHAQDDGHRSDATTLDGDDDRVRQVPVQDAIALAVYEHRDARDASTPVMDA